jgi:hypothetical protein
MSLKCRHCNVPWQYEWDYCPECGLNYGGAKYPATQTDQELEDIAELVQLIHKAFAGVMLGGGETLHQADLEGAYSDKKVWLAAREKDPESD